MRENISKAASMETFSLNGFQTPYNNVTDNQKPMLFSISSNVYYGYQPINMVQNQNTNLSINTTELMHTDELNCSLDKRPDDMDTMQMERPLVNRKRTRSGDITWGSCKKKRQNEPDKTNGLHQHQHCSSSKMVLEEELLRETHGCSYYHWVANNI